MCRQATELFSNVCLDCQNVFPTLLKHCPLCAHPMINESSSSLLCARCLQGRPFFDRVISSFLYGFPIDKIIQSIKYDHRLEFVAILGKLLVKTVEKFYAGSQTPEVIIPVPLHLNRLRKRGFNQSSMLANVVQKNLSFSNRVTVDSNVVLRINDTQSQQGLLFSERKKNVRDSFRVINGLSYKHVVILDDVVTSTATVNSISRILKYNKVRRVDVWSVARTPYYREGYE